MRFLDLGVAALIGLSSVAAIYFVGSGVGNEADRVRLKEQVALRTKLLDLLEGIGVSWFLTEGPPEICSRLKNLSNSTVEYGAIISGVGCPTIAPPGAPEANITLVLPAKTVVLQDWLRV